MASSAPPQGIRPADCAGRFYPADPHTLRTQVDRFLADGQGAVSAGTVRAVIAPHAGYLYSGPIAGSAYRSIPREVAERTRRVVVIGPSHHHRFRGIARAPFSAFATPLGEVPVEAEESTERLSGVLTTDGRPHRVEHSIEVQLPFVQRVFSDVALVALVVGEASAAEVSALLSAYLDDPQTVCVVSSDLSHFEAQDQARVHDRRTAEHIEALRGESIGPRDACGHQSLRGLLHGAKDRGWAVDRLDLRTSADTAGTPERVVGYGAWAIVAPSS